MIQTSSVWRQRMLWILQNSMSIATHPKFTWLFRFHVRRTEQVNKGHLNLYICMSVLRMQEKETIENKQNRVVERTYLEMHINAIYTTIIHIGHIVIRHIILFSLPLNK